MEEGGGAGVGDFDRLPEECISHVLSFTLPVDTCRSAAVSAALRSAVDSDTVWERLLPPEYREIIDGVVDPVEFSSKREIYFWLCDPVLINGGTMSFQLEKSCGAKCYMISARELSIAWADSHSWIKRASVTYASLDARFSEVARLLNGHWVEVHGKIESRILTPKTKYAAYFVFKLDGASRDFRHPAQETSVKIRAHESKYTICVEPRKCDVNPRIFCRRPSFIHGVVTFFANPYCEDYWESTIPSTRTDGWMEIELGWFFIDNGDDGEAQLHFRGGRWRSGLTILGIEVRPKK